MHTKSVVLSISKGYFQRFLNLGSDVTEFRKLHPYTTANYFLRREFYIAYLLFRKTLSDSAAE